MPRHKSIGRRTALGRPPGAPSEAVPGALSVGRLQNPISPSLQGIACHSPFSTPIVGLGLFRQGRIDGHPESNLNSTLIKLNPKRPLLPCLGVAAKRSVS